MKIMVFILLPLFSFGQNWSGATNHYTISSEHIQLNASNEGDYRISSDSTIVLPVEISFQVELDFNPSNNNYILFGWSDANNEEYIFQVGENGSNDGVQFLNQDFSVLDGCFASRPKFYCQFIFYGDSCKISIQSENCSFDTLVHYSASDSLALEFFFQSSVTSSNTNGVSISNFSKVHYEPDITPPSLVRADTIFAPKKLNLIFDESINEFEVENPYDYSIERIGDHILNIAEGGFKQEDTIYLKVRDISGNVEQYNISLFIPPLEYQSIVFSEAMLKPDPLLRESNCEFIELYNRTDRLLRIERLEVSINGNPRMYSTILNPRGFCLISDTSHVLPSLSNQGISLQLDINQRQMDFWEAKMEEENFKSEGGWSLERLMTENCVLEESSYSNGLYGHSANELFFSSETPTFQIEWKPIRYDQDENLYRLKTTPNLLSFSNLFSKLNNQTVSANDRGEIEVAVPNALEEYVVEIQGDFCNSVISKRRTFILGPQQRLSQKVFQINEVLANSMDADFVEFYFEGQGCVLSDSILLEVESISGVKRIYRSNGNVICPKEYYVFVDEATNLKCHRNANVLFTNAAFDLPNEYARIKLLSARGKVLNEFKYSSDMHHDAYTDFEDLALGLFNGEWRTYTNRGTPTLSNPGENAFEELKVEVQDLIHFHYGSDDFLKVRVEQKGNHTASLSVFDRSGIQVAVLGNQKPFTDILEFSWEGRIGNGRMIQPGIYLLLIETFDENGKRNRTTKVFTVN